MQEYKTPLNPDALSAFCRNDANYKEHEEEIKEATEYLTAVYIPRIAHSLSKKLQSPEDWLHNYGINLRYMGLVRKKIQQINASTTDVKKRTILQNNIDILLEVMCARILKRIIHGRMRIVQNEELGQTKEQPLKEEVVAVLNLLLEKSHEIWISEESPLKRLLLLNYGEAALSSEERHSDISASLHMVSFFEKVETTCSISLSDQAWKELKHKYDQIKIKKGFPMITDFQFNSSDLSTQKPFFFYYQIYQ